VNTEIIYIHIKNKYFVTVTKKNEEILAIFPSNYLKIPAIDTYYTSYKIEENKLIFQSSISNTKSYDVENYASRLAIVTDIVCKAKQLNIPSQLIISLDGMTTKKNILELIPVPKGKDLTKEKKFKKYYTEILENTYSEQQAIEEDILSGYKLLRTIVNNNGII
jgi:hypothetical protein